jgi:transposase
VLRNFGLKVGQVSKGRFEARIRELAAGNPMLEVTLGGMLRPFGAAGGNDRAR